MPINKMYKLEKRLSGYDEDLICELREKIDDPAKNEKYDPIFDFLNSKIKTLPSIMGSSIHEIYLLTTGTGTLKEHPHPDNNLMSIPLTGVATHFLNPETELWEHHPGIYIMLKL